MWVDAVSSVTPFFQRSTVVYEQEALKAKDSPRTSRLQGRFDGRTTTNNFLLFETPRLRGYCHAVGRRGCAATSKTDTKLNARILFITRLACQERAHRRETTAKYPVLRLRKSIVPHPPPTKRHSCVALSVARGYVPSRSARLSSAELQKLRARGSTNNSPQSTSSPLATTVPSDGGAQGGRGIAADAAATGSCLKAPTPGLLVSVQGPSRTASNIRQTAASKDTHRTFFARPVPA